MNLIEWKWMKYSFSNFLGIIWRIWLVSNVLVHWIHWDMDTCPKLDTCPYLYVSSATDDALDTISTLIWKHNSSSSPLSFLFFFGSGGLLGGLLVGFCLSSSIGTRFSWRLRDDEENYLLGDCVACSCRTVRWRQGKLRDKRPQLSQVRLHPHYLC